MPAASADPYCAALSLYRLLALMDSRLLNSSVTTFSVVGHIQHIPHCIFGAVASVHLPCLLLRSLIIAVILPLLSAACLMLSGLIPTLVTRANEHTAPLVNACCKLKNRLRSECEQFLIG